MMEHLYKLKRGIKWLHSDRTRTNLSDARTLDIKKNYDNWQSIEDVTSGEIMLVCNYGSLLPNTSVFGDLQVLSTESQKWQCSNDPVRFDSSANPMICIHIASDFQISLTSCFNKIISKSTCFLFYYCK